MVERERKQRLADRMDGLYSTKYPAGETRLKLNFISVLFSIQMGRLLGEPFFPPETPRKLLPAYPPPPPLYPLPPASVLLLHWLPRSSPGAVGSSDTGPCSQRSFTEKAVVARRPRPSPRARARACRPLGFSYTGLGRHSRRWWRRWWWRWQHRPRGSTLERLFRR